MDAALLLLTVHWMLAGVFASALLHKVRAWPRFQASMAAYGLLPAAAVPAAAGLLVVAEATALGLLLIWHMWGVLLATFLLLLYACVIGISIVRGQTHIDCGCGDEPTPVSWALVLRNFCLIGLCIWVWQLHGAGVQTADRGWLTVLVSVGLAMVAFGIYQAIEQLLANRGRHQRLWQGVS